MPTVNDNLNRVRAFKAERKWTRFKLAREAKLSPNCLRDIDNPKWNPTAHTLKSLEDVIDAFEAQLSEVGRE